MGDQPVVKPNPEPENSKKLETGTVGSVESNSEPSPAQISGGFISESRNSDVKGEARSVTSGPSNISLFGDVPVKRKVDVPASDQPPTETKRDVQQNTSGERGNQVKPIDGKIPSSATVVDSNSIPAMGRSERHVTKSSPQQQSDVTAPNTKITPQDVAPAKGTVTTPGDIPVRAYQPAGAQVADNVAQAPVKPAPVESKTSEALKPGTDATGGNRSVQNIEPSVAPSKNVVTNLVDRSQPGDVSSARTITPPVAAQNVSQQKVETPAASVQSTRGTVESLSGNVSNPGPRPEVKSLAGEIVPAMPGNQIKGEPRADQPGATAKVDPKGDVFNTQGAPLQANRQDITKGLDAKIETGRPAEQAPSKDSAPFKDPKSAGVLNETFGQKTETGPRIEPSSQIAGNKQDASTAAQRAEQITKGIEGRVNEGAKQPGATDGASSGGRQPGIDSGGKSQGIADGAQPGIKQSGATDGATATGKQLNTAEPASSTGRQPLHEGGDKGSSGGGGSVTAESTKRIDAGMGAGGKAEGQPASGGMGGGSSAPVDRAPHKPFSVEDAGQGAGGKAGDVVGGKAGDAAGAKGGDGVGGKAGDVVGGKTGDVAGVKGAAGVGPSAGPRFDTGEVRVTEPGARFDSGELKDGRSSGTQSGGLKGGDGSAVKGSDAGIVKGADITGAKGATGGGQGIGGSSGGSGSGSSGFGPSSEAGILGDKRQPPSLMPDGMVNQGGKTGKVGEGVSGGSGILGTDVPFVLPGALSGKEGGQRQSDQIFTDKGKAEGAPVGKQDAVTPVGKSDAVLAGKGEPAGLGGRGEAAGIAGKGEAAALGGKDKGQKADGGIPAAMAGQIGAGAAEVGGVLKNFAQSVLSDGKTSGQASDGTPISKDAKDASKSPAAIDGSGKEVPPVRQDFAGPGKKTQILPTDQTPGVKVVGPGGSPLDVSAKKLEPLASGSAALAGGAEGIMASAGDGDGDIVPLEEFNLPEVDLLSEADEGEEVKEIEESVEAKSETELHYELALGLQLYTSITEAQYGAYHYFTKEGDTVESVSREIVGDVRCSPLVFSLNKEHIVASTEYGVHPFKVGVMVQLPTPRDLKEFFGEQK